MLKQLIQDEKINQQLKQVVTNMEQQTKSGDQILNGSLDYLFTTGGKMLRPTLLLIGSRIGRVTPKHEQTLIDLATAIEMLHLATLVHDDIIDDAKLRRGQPSIQAKYGPAYAVYMGDYLLSQCFLMLTHLNLSKDHAVQLARVVSHICVGDMKQHQKRYDLTITPYQYIKIVTGKTAALIATALSSGAFFAKAKEEHIKLLAKIGLKIGMTFQIVDDLLDFVGDSDVIGKELRADIARGYYSMPVILALQTEVGDQLRGLLSRDMTDQALEEAFRLIRHSGALDSTRSLAIRYNDKAINLIETLPDGDTKSLLKEMIPTLLNRVL